MTTMRAMLAVILAAGLAAMWVPAQGHAAAGHVSRPRAVQKSSTKTPGVALPDAATVASVVGVTQATLTRDLAAGQTVLHIAGSRFRSADELATALLAPLKTKLDRAVASGAMPSYKAAAAYNQMHAAYAVLVVTPHPPMGTDQNGGQKAPGGGGAQTDSGIFSAMAVQCHTTVANLKAALAAGGRTPLAICQATNAQETQGALVTALVGAVEGNLGHTPTSDEHAAIQQKITYWVTTPVSAPGGPGKP